MLVGLESRRLFGEIPGLGVEVVVVWQQGLHVFEVVGEEVLLAEFLRVWEMVNSLIGFESSDDLFSDISIRPK